MRTLIFEGVATSGKSTIITQLSNKLAVHKTIKVVPETETLMKIVDNTDKSVSIAYLTEVIKDTYRDDYNMVLFDRLYLTHIFRTRSSRADYKIIEDLLRPYNPETIFLKVDEVAVADRVAKASEHRDPKWKDYIYTKAA
jgi:thymidylate kinase